MSRHRHRPGHNFDLLIAERRIGGAATGEDVPKSPAGSIEQSDYLVVGGLSEVAVALPDGEKELRGGQAHHLVGVLGDGLDGFGCADRTANATVLAPWARATWHAALTVAPVAMPSSTITAVRPVSDIRSRPRRKCSERRCSSARCLSSTASMSSRLRPA